MTSLLKSFMTNNNNNNNNRKLSSRMKHHLLLVCSLLVVLAFVSAEDEVQSRRRELRHEDWEPTHYQVYATKGELIGHERVFELLKRLQKVYEPFENEETNDRKAKVNKLIEVANKSPEKCTREYLRELHDLVERHFSYRKGVLPYLRHHFYECVSMCEKYILHTKVANITETEVANMQRLASFILETRVNGIAAGQLTAGRPGLEYLYKGTLAFMENKLGSNLPAEIFVKGSKGNEAFKGLFDFHVSQVCRSWIEATDSARAMNEFFVNVDFSDDETSWLQYGSLCHDIEFGQDKLVQKLARHFKKQAPSRGLVRRTMEKVRSFNCLSRKAAVEM